MTGLLRKVRAALPALVLVAAVAPVLIIAPSAQAEDVGAVTVNKTITRTHLQLDGSEKVASTSNFSVSVSQTNQLRGRQDVDVSWKGAIPTSAVVSDPNGINASLQEFPVAILECRGTADTVTPQTCWTHGANPRYTASNNALFPAWRVDRYASPAERAAVVGAPSPYPDACAPANVEHWLPFDAAGGTVYPYGNTGCAGIPPEDATIDAASNNLPDNSTFAQTHADGTGLTKFDIWTDAENASLGCSAAVDCTLEVIPIVGISCDAGGHGSSLPATDLPDALDPSPGNTPSGVQTTCEGDRTYSVGEPFDLNQPPRLADSGSLWWSASNWRNRISIPLGFAPVSTACSSANSSSSSYVYGSELMLQATQQWAPHFCSDPSLFQFTHVTTSEPLARTLLSTSATSAVDAIFSSQPPTGGFAVPTVQAPVGVTGFAISYTVDDSQGRPVTNLRLTPRLLAKLMTESYVEDDFDRFKTGQYPYLGSGSHRNPYNITYDPEFIALNPGIHIPFGDPGPSTLIQLLGGSDVTYALTSYIWADPEARYWLEGHADPWGMVVNPAYKLPNNQHFSMPTNNWPLLDNTVPDFAGNIPCELTDPTPYLQAVAAPTVTMDAIALAVQFAAPTAKINCASLDGTGSGVTQWISVGRTIPGVRFVIGITSLGAASRYDLQTAALQTSATVKNMTTPFTSSAGRTFVGPSTASLKSAVALLKPDLSTNTWPVPYATLRSTSSAKDAYPGTMVVYADVPVTGLPAVQANNYAKLLQFAAGPGQSPGSGVGELPDGYLPLTPANGLGALASYTAVVASDVAAQNGTVPPIAAASSTTTGGSAGSGSGGSATTGGSNGDALGSGGSPTPSASAQSPAVPSPSKTTPTAAGPTLRDQPSASLAAATTKTPRIGSAVSGAIVLVLLVIALVAGACAASPLLSGRRMWPWR